MEIAKWRSCTQTYQSYYKHFEYLFVILSIKRNLFDSLGVIKTY